MRPSHILPRSSSFFFAFFLSFPVVFAQAEFDLVKTLDLAVGWIPRLFQQSPPSVIFGILVVAFWVLLYGITMIAFRRHYGDQTIPKELKIVAGSLALIMVLGFFFAAGTEPLSDTGSFAVNNVYERAANLLATFNGLAAVLISIFLYLGLSAIFNEMGVGIREGWNWLAAVLSFFIFISLWGIGFSVKTRTTLQDSVIGLFVFIILLLLLGWLFR